MPAVKASYGQPAPDFQAEHPPPEDRKDKEQEGGNTQLRQDRQIGVMRVSRCLYRDISYSDLVVIPVKVQVTISKADERAIQDHPHGRNIADDSSFSRVRIIQALICETYLIG